MIAPATTTISLRFGATTPPYSPANPHKGTDYRTKRADGSTDMNCYAAEDGSLSLFPWDGKATVGNMAVLSFGDTRLAYCHLSRFEAPAGPVKKGQVVGIMGDTGYAFGVHLHITMRLNGQLTDITKYINEQGGKTMPLISRADVENRFNFFLGYPPTEEQIKYYGEKGWGVLNDDTINALKKQKDDMAKALGDLRTALENEQKKPPREVVKEVEKIVEKQVLVNDLQTQQNVNRLVEMVSAIYNYFYARYQTFRDSLNK